jgi:hypothetical protein
MGVIISCIFNPPIGIYTIEEEVRRWKAQFEILQLNEKEIGQLYKVFKDVDLNKEKVVKSAHLAQYLKVENNLFEKRMLSSFKWGLKFEGFVFEIWNMCTIGEKDLGIHDLIRDFS